MNLPVTLLCKNPGSTPEKRMEQALMCATIDGYTDGDDGCCYWQKKESIAQADTEVE